MNPKHTAYRPDPAHRQPCTPLLAVVGPTASGKSGLALQLAETLGGEIVNADSLQVYRGLDIGTSKPSAAERARVPHHLLDVVPPDAPYSAGRYAEDAQSAIADIAARGRVPILCGGTGLYYRALLFGLAEVPPISRAVRQAVEAHIAAEGAPAAHAALARVDADTAAAVHPQDVARIARALEVFEATGLPLSDYRRAQPKRAPALDVFSVGVSWARPALYARVDARVREMLSQGWIAEVQALLARGYSARLKPLRAIGYAEIAAHLLEGASAQDLAERIAQRTRRYAKRQLTWFRQHPEVRWGPPEATDAVVQAARNFLLRHRQRR